MCDLSRRLRQKRQACRNEVGNELSTPCNPVACARTARPDGAVNQSGSANVGELLRVSIIAELPCFALDHSLMPAASEGDCVRNTPHERGRSILGTCRGSIVAERGFGGGRATACVLTLTVSCWEDCASQGFDAASFVVGGRTGCCKAH